MAIWFDKAGVVTQLLLPIEKLRDYKAVLVYIRSFKALLTIHCTSCFELNLGAETTQTEQTQEVNSFLKRIIFRWAVGSDVKEKRLRREWIWKQLQDFLTHENDFLVLSFSLRRFSGGNEGLKKFLKHALQKASRVVRYTYITRFLTYYARVTKYKQNPTYTVLKEIVGLMWTPNDSLWCLHNVAYDAAVLDMYENITPKTKCRELLHNLTWLKRSEARSYLTK
mgnify:CR=1 FL=1